MLVAEFSELILEGCPNLIHVFNLKFLNHDYPVQTTSFETNLSSELTSLAWFLLIMAQAFWIQFSEEEIKIIV